jgi:hypothetical protein
MQMDSRDLPPEDQEWIAALADMAGTVAQLVASKASREGRPIDHGDYLNAAGGVLGTAYELAKLGGQDALRAYARLVRSHAEAVERSLK